MNRKFLILNVMMLFITIILLFSLTTNVSATTIKSAKITITPSKTEYKSGDKIEFIVALKDLDASRGILGLGAYIDYDSDLLTLDMEAEGLSKWMNADISKGTHRFATTKNSYSSNNENILKITFIAKKVTKNVTTAVKLQQIQISNGSEYRIEEVSSNKITIKQSSGESEKPPVTPAKPSNSVTPTKTSTPSPSAKPNTPSKPANPSSIPSSTKKPSAPSSKPSSTATPSKPKASPAQDDEPDEPTSTVAPTNPDASNEENNVENSINTELNANNTQNNNSEIVNNNGSQGKSNSKLPQLGNNNGYLLAVIAGGVVIAVFTFVKMKKLKKLKK